MRMRVDELRVAGRQDADEAGVDPAVDVLPALDRLAGLVPAPRTGPAIWAVPVLPATV